MRAAKVAGLLAGAALAVSAFCLAASADTVTLSPEQTYALYMRDFTVTYHDTSADIDYPLNTIFMGTSAEVAPPENLFVSGNIIDNTNTAIVPLWKLHNYIIVRFAWPADSVPTRPIYARDDFITIENNLNVAGLNYFSGRILVTVGNAYRPSTSTAWSTVLRTDYKLETSEGVITHQNVIGGSGRPSRILTGLSQNEGTIPQDDILFMTSDASAYWFDSANALSISKLTTIWRSPVQWGYTDQSHSNIDRINSWIAYIECPTLSSGYIPPTTTPVTTTATTRREFSVLPPQSTAPAHTVDLSNLESGVAAIVQQEQEINNNLEWIGYNVMGGVNNLAYICNRLDDIYRDMVKAGQIPTNLFPMDGTILEDIQNGLTSYTTARIPTDAVAGLSFWSWLMGKITAVAFIGELAAFGAVLAVTYFILFRGRNS